MSDYSEEVMAMSEGEKAYRKHYPIKATHNNRKER